MNDIINAVKTALLMAGEEVIILSLLSSGKTSVARKCETCDI